jgi:hypothetical protein
MKKIQYIASLFSLLLVLACNKSKDFYEELGKGSYLTLVPKGSGTNKNLNATDPANAISLKVDSYGEEVQSVNVYVSATNTLDTTKWKLIKNVPFTKGETTLSVTNAQIATALGLTPGSLAPGSIFYLWNQAITKDGRRFGSYNNSAADLESQVEFNVAFRWTATVVCPFSPAPFDNQTYVIMRDDWEDFAVGDEVQVRLGPGANQITLVGVFPTVDAHQDLVLNVDPASGSATAARYTYGAYSVGGTKYTAATAGTGNFVFACTQTIDVTLNHMSVGGTNFGNLKLILKKK